MTAALEGRRILITRAERQMDDYQRALEHLGAIPVLFPTIAIAPPLDTAALERAVLNLDHYDWVVFTSANGVHSFFECWHKTSSSARFSPKTAVIGPATARALEREGVRPNLVPREFVAEALAEALQREEPLAGKCILLPRADIARRTLVTELERCGARVENVVAYRTVPAESGSQAMAALCQGVDAITFTSSSTVRNFAALTRDVRYPEALIACIGPITARTAKDLGFRVDAIAQNYTIKGLVEALVKLFEGLEPR